MPLLGNSRQRGRGLTLSQKVSLAICLAVASMIGFFLVEGIREQKILLRELSRHEAELVATLLRTSLEDPRLWESPEAFQAFVDRIAASESNSGRLDVLVLDSQRIVRAASRAGEIGKRYSRDPGTEIDHVMTDGRMREFVEVGVTPASWFAVRLEVSHGEKGVLLFRSPRAATEALAHEVVLEISWEATLVAIPALLVILVMTRRYLLRPIQLLREGASAWKGGDLSHRVAFRGADELGELRNAFNDMATTLEAQYAALARKQVQLEESLRRYQEAQAQLIQAEKLASLGTLTAGVAHELNQPLTLIRGYAQRLLRREGDVNPKVQREIAIIEGETARMDEIIQHLRDFSRQSTGEYQGVDVNGIIPRALTLLSEELRRRRIEVRLALDPTLPQVWGDPNQLTQVFVNLITNARDALDEVGAGILMIQSRLGPENTVEISFTDTGPGVAPEILPRIFDPFFTTKTVGKGTGLGLSIALGLIQTHGGKIDVDSQVGKGTRFTIVLPADRGKSDGKGSDPRGR